MQHDIGIRNSFGGQSQVPELKRTLTFDTGQNKVVIRYSKDKKDGYWTVSLANTPPNTPKEDWRKYRSQAIYRFPTL